MKNKQLHYTLFSTAFFAYNRYDSLRKLLVYLTQMWQSRGIANLSLTVTSGILIEFMMLPCFAHTTDYAKLMRAAHRHSDIMAFEFQDVDTISSLKEGQWTDPTVWSVGRVPTVGDVILLLHTVTIPSGVLAKAQRVLYGFYGELLFDDSTSSLQLGFILSANQLRIKTVQGNPTSTTYTYDGQNRLATITSSNQLSIYSYGDAQNFNRLYQYPNPTDQTRGSALLFPYSITGRTSYPTYTYAIIQSNLALLTNSESYSLDVNGHVSSVWRGPGNVVTNPNQFTTHVYSFTYTGENITTVMRTTFKSNDYVNVYEYDTKINPFFGSTDPSLDDTQRFSLNNVTKITTSNPNAVNLPSPIVVYQYEYNQQGLPTKRTTVQGGTDILTYTYERIN